MNQYCLKEILLLLLLLIFINAQALGSQHGQSNNPSHIPENFNIPNQMVHEEIPWATKNRVEPPGEISKKCLLLLEIFSNATSTYLKCIMCNARPLHYCENCVSEYSTAHNAYHGISQPVENGTRCKDELERADNVQVVNLVSDFIEVVWDKSDCRNCYNSTKNGTTTTYKPTEETLKMLDKIQDVQSCFHDFSSHDVENASVCFLCKQLYIDANDYYNMLDNEDKLCSDLEDSMNYTRRMWSKDLHCINTVHPDLMIYGIAIAVGFVPLLFYLGLYYHGKRQLSVSMGSRRDSEIQALNEEENEDHPQPSASTSGAVDL